MADNREGRLDGVDEEVEVIGRVGVKIRGDLTMSYALEGIANDPAYLAAVTEVLNEAKRVRWDRIRAKEEVENVES